MRFMNARRLPLCAIFATVAACGTPGKSVTNTSSCPTAHDAGGGPLQLQSAGLCLDTVYDSNAAGTAVQLWSCDGMSNQQWSFTGSQLTVFGNMCLQGGASSLQIQPCDSTNAQQQFTGNGATLVASNGQCLTASSASQGAPITLSACQGGAATQAWSLPAPSGGTSTGDSTGGTSPGGSSTGTTTGSVAAPTGPVAGNQRVVQVINNCAQTVYAGAFFQTGTQFLPNNGGWMMPAGSSNSFTLPVPWSGRFWARTGCSFDASDTGSCETGDCNGQLECGTTSAQPASLAEFTFGGYQGQDFYDLSLVEGFNIPISITPVPGTFASSGGSPFACGAPACTSNLLSSCPANLQHNANGQEVACYNACFALGGDVYCCSGNYSSRETCVPNQYSEFFKQGCPDAYSYPDDDATSVYACQATTYQVTFCPQ